MAKVTKVKNKGSKQEMLPHRHALAQLTGGDPYKRNMNNYAKVTPGVGQNTRSIVDMGADSDNDGV